MLLRVRYEQEVGAAVVDVVHQVYLDPARVPAEFGPWEIVYVQDNFRRVYGTEILPELLSSMPVNCSKIGRAHV